MHSLCTTAPYAQPNNSTTDAVAQLIDGHGRTLAERIVSAQSVQRSRELQQLHLALTDQRSISNYAGLSPELAEQAADAVADALAEIGCPIRAKKRRKLRPATSDDARISPDSLATLEQADLFADPVRWPRRPYCSLAKNSGMRIRGLQQALLHPYISVNPPHLRVWSLFDVDREDAAGAWEAAGLPPPAWTAINKENGHAHHVWGLRAPVLVEGHGVRSGPLRYLCAVESLMRERMQADRGFANLLTKNPAWPGWRVLRGPTDVYDLGELAQFLPGLEKHIPKKRGDAERIGLGRNITVFDELRHWAYRAIRRHWAGLEARGKAREEAENLWKEACYTHALDINGQFPTPLQPNEVKHIAKSVAKWTAANCTSAGFSKFQANAGQRGGLIGAGGRPRTVTAQGEPWVAAGISRATWYRRRQSGILVPAECETK